MNEFLKRLREQFDKVWGNLTRMQKILAAASGITLLVMIAIFSMLSSRIDYATLYSGLEPKEASSIKTFLVKNNIKYRIKGNTIEVESKEKDSVYLDLAKDDLLPQSGDGYEIFDKQNIMSTEFDKKISLERARKRALERIIGRIESIKNVDVNITPANESVFAEEKTFAKVAIMIELRPLEKISDEQIKTIMRIAKASVPELPAENVEISDTNGNLLSERVEMEESSSSIVSNKKLEYQKRIEKDLENKVMSQLSVLGSGNARAKVTIELDYDKEISNEEMFSTPVINGEQQLNGLVRSKQENLETYDGTGTAAEGIAGTSSNLPGYVGTTGGGIGKKYTKSNNIVNYDLNNTKKSYEKATGKIKRMSVSVILNEKAGYFKNKKFDEVIKKEFENIVKPSVSFDERRGDFINVTVVPFDTKAVDKYTEDVQKQEQTQFYMFVGIVVVIILALFGVAAFFIMQRMEDKKLREKERQAVADLIPEIEEVTLGEQVSVEEQERVEKEDQIKEIAKNNPESVAGLIRSWMIED